MYAGKPENVEDYRFFEVDGINVYVPKEEQLKKEQISINVKGFGPFKQLVIDGI